MSLINQMLKDLEHQKHSKQENPSILADLDGKPNPIKSRRYRPNKILFALIATATVSSISFAYYNIQPHMQTAAINHASALVTHRNTLESAAVIETESRLATPTTPTTPTTPATPLEQKAEKDTPSIASTQPTTVLKKVAIEIKHIPAEAPKTIPKTIIVKNQSDSINISSSSSRSLPIPVEVKAKAVASKQQVETASKPVNLQVVTKSPRPLDKEQQAKHYFHQGQQHINAGAYTLAQVALQKSLEFDPHLSTSRELLAKLYIKQGRLVDAENLLTLGLSNMSQQPKFNKLAARIAIERGDISKGIEYLEQTLPALQSDPDHHALLAASYQRTGAYKRASNLYQQLVTIFPDQSVWWMGLGIAQSNSDAWTEAYHAFIQAYQGGGLNRASAQYVKGQIIFLEEKLRLSALPTK